MILFYDTETTGLVKDNLPPDSPAQPHLVQLAAVLTEDDGQERMSMDMIVRPDGYTIPDVAAKVHGITTAIAARVGLPLQVAVGAFVNLRALADLRVGHNEKFDERVMLAAIHRTGRKPSHPGPIAKACTMELGTDLLKLPATDKMKAAGYGGKYKPPKLEELYMSLHGEAMENAHDAMFDVRACIDCFFELARRGLVPDWRRTS